jgi:hypothetical protein
MLFCKNHSLFLHASKAKIGGVLQNILIITVEFYITSHFDIFINYEKENLHCPS